MIFPERAVIHSVISSVFCRLNSIFRQILFDADGSEIYLKPATRYVKPNKEVDFYTVLESAKKKGETAIGYRISAQAFDSNKSYGVRVNPVKTEKIKFSESDKIIVLAEN